MQAVWELVRSRNVHRASNPSRPTLFLFDQAPVMRPPQVESSVYPPPGAELLTSARNRRVRLATKIAIALMTLAVTVLAVSWSLDPQRYFSYAHQDRSQWIYQPGPVAIVCSLFLGEGVLLGYVFTATRPRAMWVRCVMVLCALAPVSALSAMTVMHAPAYFHLHVIWVWALTLLVLCTLGVVVARSLLQRTKTAPLG